MPAKPPATRSATATKTAKSRAATTKSAPTSAAATDVPVPSVDEQVSGPLLLLDGMSLGYRAYFALPPSLMTSVGIVTNAVHGFTSMLTYLIR